MSPEYLSPGVYVEEIDKGSKPIEGAGTAMAAFVGFAEQGPINQPTFIPNWSEFVNNFGSFVKGVYLAPAVYGYFQNGGGRCYVTRLPSGDDKAAEPKAVAALPSRAQPSIESLTITALETGPAGAEISVEVAKPSGEGAPEDQFNLIVRRGATEEVFDNLGFSKAKGARHVVDVVCPPGLTPQQVKDWRMNEAGYDTKYGAVYYPWIKVANPLGNGEGMLIPPSGYMAGIYARSDTERGVHKAPANEVVRGAMAVEMQITKSEQDILNPIGVNCIRAFPGRGIRVWGARTLSSDASWRYINVRRLFNFVEKSIELGTQWVVFEPNDMDLWERVKRDIKAFLTRVWRDGALFGATPAEAFFVKCDEELNPPSVRDAGQLIIEIGIAPVKPAEFVIFRISQWAGGGAVAE